MSLRTPSARHAMYAATLIALTTATAMAWAEPSPALDRASLSVGAFYTDPRIKVEGDTNYCLLYTSPSPRDATLSRMPSSA